MSTTTTIQDPEIRALKLENENLRLKAQMAEMKVELSEAQVRLPLVNQKLAKVMAAIPAITKKKGQGISYTFRGVDDVYNALHPLMKQEGLVMAPVGQREVKHGQYTTGRGATMFTITGICKYRVIAEDGSYEEVEVTSTGQSPSEKAPLNMMSAAHKYALLQLFMIPTEESAAQSREAFSPPPAKTQAQILAEEAREREMQEAMQQARETLLATDSPEEFLAVLKKRVPPATLNNPKWENAFAMDSLLLERTKDASEMLKQKFLSVETKQDWMETLKSNPGIFEYRIFANRFKGDPEIQKVKAKIFK